MIQRHLLDNPHRLTLVATADGEYDAQLQRAEETALADTKARLGEEGAARCVAAALELQANPNPDPTPNPPPNPAPNPSP